jgi:hypothetical protein
MKIKFTDDINTSLITEDKYYTFKDINKFINYVFPENLNISVLKTETNTLYNCFLKEQLILKENSESRIFKKWSTELLKDIDINKYF